MTCAIPGVNSNQKWAFGVSTDSIESHQEFIKKHGLPFPLLSDSDQEIVKAYQVWAEKSIDGEKRMGTERTTYLIGPDRKINPNVS